MAANSREYPAAGTKDVFLPLEAREFGDRLYKPISSSLRIKYSCFAVSGQLIVLGANTGAVYVLVRDSLSYIGFIPNKVSALLQQHKLNLHIYTYILHLIGTRYTNCSILSRW